MTGANTKRHGANACMTGLAPGWVISTTTTLQDQASRAFHPTVPEMLKSRGLNHTNRDSLSSGYLSDQSPDGNKFPRQRYLELPLTFLDLELLLRFNSLLSFASLPKLSNILDVTPSLLIALYESIPPFQRVPFVDVSAPGFGARLRNMKLLVGSIASGRYGLLTNETREKLEELNLRRFCEKDLDAVRDAIEIMVQVGERGQAAVAGSETPKKCNISEPIRTPRLRARTGKIAGNDLECTPTPKKRPPVLVLPVGAKTDDGESFPDEKDSGWDGSTLGVLSQAGQDGNTQDGLVGLSKTIALDIGNSKSRRAVRKSRSSPAPSTSSSSCLSISPHFLEDLSARVNAIVDRHPAPPPYSEEDQQDENDEEDIFDTPRQPVHRNDLTPKATPVKRLFAERVYQRNAQSDRFGDELLSSQDEDVKKSSQGSMSRVRNIATDAVKGGISRDRVAKEGGANVEEGKSERTWITEDQSGAESRRSFASLAKKDVLNSTPKKPFTPTRAIRWDADGAAYVPLPPSRPTSPVSGAYSKRRGNGLPSKSPLPFPPSLLRTMHWATSLPTPPLSPKTHRAPRIPSQSATSINSLITPSRMHKSRRVITATPLSPIVSKKLSPGRRNSIGGPSVALRKFPGRSDLVVEVDDRCEWESIQSSKRVSKQSQFSRSPRDDRGQMPLSFPTTLVSPEPDELASRRLSLDIYGNDRGSSTEPGSDSDDRTTLYSVSTVSWGDDDPFTAALRLKRQLAFEKLREVERNFSSEIERKRMSGPDISVADRLRWRAAAEEETADEETDSDGGFTDVEEELRALEEIGRKESIRQGMLLQRLMEREV